MSRICFGSSTRTWQIANHRDERRSDRVLVPCHSPGLCPLRDKVPVNYGGSPTESDPIESAEHNRVTSVG